MKKALIASTALVLTAGVATADVINGLDSATVKLSGYGRTAVDYQEGRTGNDTQIETRLRLNIDVSNSTDQGVDFGGRIRLQYDDGSSNSNLSPATLYVSASGLKVSVGNVDTAYDGAALMYESEVGLISRSHGTSRDYSYYSFSTGGYGSDNNRMGIAAQYDLAGATIKASYVDPDQTGLTGGNEELSLSVGYKMNDVQLSAAAVRDGAGREGNDRYFLGAYYTMPGTKNGIGLNWTDDGIDSAGVSNGDIWVLYGDYEVAPLTTLSAYAAHNDKVGNETDTAFGVGGKYDLGGAYLAASLERGYDENVRGDFGVRFDF